MLSFRIAWRFLQKSPAQSALIICGIAVGIAVQIFVGSLIQSLQANLVQQTIGSGPQITIQAFKTGESVIYTNRMQNLLRNDSRVKSGAVAPVRLISSLWTNGTDSAPLNVIGSTVAGLDGVYHLSDKMVAGKLEIAPNQVLLGKEFADKYSLKVGDTISLTFQGSNTATFRVSGIYDLGTAAFNERNAFTSENVPRGLLGWSSNEYSAIYTQVVDPFRAGVIALQWQTQLPDVEVIDWQAQNANLLTALRSQSVSSYMIQTFVLVAVALGIASTLAISAVQKTRQIGILKAMGMTDRRSGLVFLWQALLLGGAGSTAGVALAYFLLFGFSFSGAPFTISPQPWFVVFSATVGVFVALLSAIIPTRKTSRLDPIEVIQSA
jgi:lipoprotein-releasing system permease protein